jgi:hypothetical protein
VIARRFRMVMMAGLLCVGLWGWGTPYTHAADVSAATAQPSAALLSVASDGAAVVVLEFPADDRGAVTIFLPPGAVARLDASDTIGRLIERYAVPLETNEILEFNGELDATAIPTLTPYVRSTPVAGVLTQIGAAVTLPTTPIGATGTIRIECVGCAGEWYVPLLQQLPVYAPVVAVGQGVATCAGLWRVQAQPDADIGSGFPTGVVTMMVVETPAGIARCTFGADQSAAIRTPVRTVTADGTQTLLRVVFCLVAVLFLSISSFYGALALTKRMQRAVDFRPDNR